MRDAELTTRPGKGWTPWTTRGGAASIAITWWQAKELHFPKLNLTVYFDGSDLVGIEDWGANPPRLVYEEAARRLDAKAARIP